MACAYAQINVKVDIQGLEKELEKNVRLFLSIEQQKNDELISEGRLKRLHQKAPEEIKKALQPYGYYRVEVKSEFQRLATDASKQFATDLNKPVTEGWYARYQVNPGAKIPVAEFNFTLGDVASQDIAFIKLIDSFTLKPGTPFNHQVYEDMKSDLARLASERGYFDARFTHHRVEINLQQYEAKVDLEFVAGLRYRFGEVKYSQSILDESLLRKYIPFKQGDYFDLDRLINFQQALNDSDYFSVVEVTPGQPDAITQEIPIQVLLTARKSQRIILGLGYGTDTGARTQFGWLFPRLNGQGHRLNTQAKFSELGYSFTAQYSLPVLNPRTDQLIYSAGVVNEKTDTSDSTVKTLGVSLNHRRGAWREVLSLSYQQEDFIVADTMDETALLMPGINWSRFWGNEFWGNQIIKAFDGIRLEFGFRLASTELVSDVDFTQVNVSMKAIHRLSRSQRLLTRLKLGHINTNEFERLPSSIRYFSGGAQSVRGYRYQSLGPVDEDDDVTGGQYLVEGSVEYEYSLNSRWGLALFIDAGNALTGLEDINSELQHGAGFGLRWKSPVGPVRFDLASAISLDGNPWRLHINIGPDL